MPADLDQYVQEAGRIGRDGLPSHAVVIYHRHSNVGKSMTIESKEYVKITACRRAFLQQYFDCASIEDLGHSCCDICCHKCDCGDHTSLFSLPEKFLPVFNNFTESSDSVSSD